MEQKFQALLWQRGEDISTFCYRHTDADTLALILSFIPSVSEAHSCLKMSTCESDGTILDKQSRQQPYVNMKRSKGSVLLCWDSHICVWASYLIAVASWGFRHIEKPEHIFSNVVTEDKSLIHCIQRVIKSCAPVWGQTNLQTNRSVFKPLTFSSPNNINTAQQKG